MNQELLFKARIFKPLGCWIVGGVTVLIISVEDDMTTLREPGDAEIKQVLVSSGVDINQDGSGDCQIKVSPMARLHQVGRP